MQPNNEKKQEEFIAVVIRADIYSGVSEVAPELEKLNNLGEKYKELPFGFLFCFDTVSEKYGNQTQARINRNMGTDRHGGYYRNDTALMITIVLTSEKFPADTLMTDTDDGLFDRKPTPEVNIAYAKKMMGAELIRFFPEALKKQVRNYPTIKKIIPSLIADFEHGVKKLGWG
ncbi:hypothetical protein [Listeria costaricensis]|uniref:hypothetical protein n=1 Tax=Listeria costaricensis TaxID=2026604 RepID=UPI000C07241D|nr:hypothetical protein [Listeria costaricensis]